MGKEPSPVRPGSAQGTRASTERRRSRSNARATTKLAARENGSDGKDSIDRADFNIPGLVRLSEQTEPDESPIFRSAAIGEDGELLLRPHESISTMFDLLEYAATNHSTSLIQFRKSIATYSKWKKDETHPLFVPYLDTYTKMTYAELREMACNIGYGLRTINVKPKQRVTIFASTSHNWFATAHGALSQNITITTAYPSLGAEALAFSLTQAKSEVLFCDAAIASTARGAIEIRKETWEKMRAKDPSLPKYTDDLHTVVVFTDASSKKPLPIKDNDKSAPFHYTCETTAAIEEAGIDALKKDFGLNVLTIEELLHKGKAREDRSFSKPTADDLACIMYTSGSTGAPKGVCIKHSNVVSAVAGANANTNGNKYINKRRDAILAYLPAAHILEFVFENLAFFWGVRIGYGNARTLSDDGVYDKLGDVSQFQPTILVGVPRVWRKIQNGILNALGQSGPIRMVFDGLFRYKRSGWPGHSIVDIPFAPIRRKLGGKLRACFNGSASLLPEEEEFFDLVLAKMVGGYGLTETCAMGALGGPDAARAFGVGPIPQNIDIKFKTSENYQASDEIGSMSRGIIMMRGPSIAHKYLDNPKESEATFGKNWEHGVDGDLSKRWINTGDLGWFTSKGHLAIGSRTKGAGKLADGEYVVPGVVEEKIAHLAYLVGAIIDVNQQQNRPGVIVGLNPGQELERFLEANGISAGGKLDLEALSTNPALETALLKTFKKLIKDSRETPTAIVIHPTFWVVGKELTHTSKISAKDVRSPEIEERLKQAYAKVAARS